MVTYINRPESIAGLSFCEGTTRKEECSWSGGIANSASLIGAMYSLTCSAANEVAVSCSRAGLNSHRIWSRSEKE